jgi:hypothetical protein
MTGMRRTVDTIPRGLARSRRSFGRMMAGPKWERWSPARRLAWWYFLPWNFALGVVAAAVVGVVAMEMLGAIN